MAPGIEALHNQAGAEEQVAEAGEIVRIEELASRFEIRADG